jgi:hypothetical protein
MLQIVASFMGNNTNLFWSSSRRGSTGCCDFTAGDVVETTLSLLMADMISITIDGADNNDYTG